MRRRSRRRPGVSSRPARSQPVNVLPAALVLETPSRLPALVAVGPAEARWPGPGSPKKPCAGRRFKGYPRTAADVQFVDDRAEPAEQQQRKLEPVPVADMLDNPVYYFFDNHIDYLRGAVRERVHRSPSSPRPPSRRPPGHEVRMASGGRRPDGHHQLLARLPAGIYQMLGLDPVAREVVVHDRDRHQERLSRVRGHAHRAADRTGRGGGPGHGAARRGAARRRPARGGAGIHAPGARHSGRRRGRRARRFPRAGLHQPERARGRCSGSAPTRCPRWPTG